MAQIFPIDFEEKLTMAQDDYILFSDSEDGNKIKKAQYSNLKWEKWDTWEQWPQGIQGIQWPQGEQWIQWPQGEQWIQGIQWEKWETWASINSAAFSGNDIVFGETDWSSVTLADAKTTLTWPQWPQGIQGETWATWATGATWPQWPTWATWNWISTITETTSWKIHTVEITETNWNTTTFTVSDGADGEWAWDVLWPNSSTDGDIALFDGITWKIIKDSWKTISWLESSISANTTAIGTINWKIPSAATSSNQLADKNYVDNSINSVAAYYITKNAAWDQFATYAELAAATTFYSWWVVRDPTRNDYTIVLDDETHGDEITRYIYNNGWEYQYSINESPMTQAQLDALNSWITSAKVSTYDGYASWKQNTLESWTNIKTINSTSLLGSWDIAVQTPLESGTSIKTVNSTSLLWSGNIAVQPTLVSWTNIKTINSNSILWSGNLDIDWLPSQTGQAWKYLTTDWTTASWWTVSGWITNDTTWTTTTVAKIWAWTEAEYSSLSTKDEHTIYYTF